MAVQTAAAAEAKFTRVEHCLTLDVNNTGSEDYCKDDLEKPKCTESTTLLRDIASHKQSRL